MKMLIISLIACSLAFPQADAKCQAYKIACEAAIAAEDKANADLKAQIAAQQKQMASLQESQPILPTYMYILIGAAGLATGLVLTGHAR